MDLYGSWMKPSPKNIQKNLTNPSLHYNWSGWRYICTFLEHHGMDMSNFDGSNDGKLIPRNDCMKVADIMEKYIGELSQEDQEWLKPHIECWKWAKNYKQY
jgi:hypothetical protein